LKIPSQLYLDSLPDQSWASYIEFYEGAYYEFLAANFSWNGVSNDEFLLFCLKMETALRICKIYEDHCGEESSINLV
jgi:hypothetical protein